MQMQKYSICLLKSLESACVNKIWCEHGFLQYMNGTIYLSCNEHGTIYL